MPAYQSFTLVYFIAKLQTQIPISSHLLIPSSRMSKLQQCWISVTKRYHRCLLDKSQIKMNYWNDQSRVFFSIQFNLSLFLKALFGTSYVQRINRREIKGEASIKDLAQGAKYKEVAAKVDNPIWPRSPTPITTEPPQPLLLTGQFCALFQPLLCFFFCRSVPEEISTPIGVCPSWVYCEPKAMLLGAYLPLSLHKLASILGPSHPSSNLPNQTLRQQTQPCPRSNQPNPDLVQNKPS